VGASAQSPIGTISLPKGGGAVSGIGEKFSPDLHTGTGNFSIPIAVPPGRNGFQPQLSLNYSTGNGNGPFGLGWALSVPGVTRLTSKGIPRYRDDAEPDVFVLSGAEDLVAVDASDPAQIRYRPRTEGLFAHIIRHRTAATDHWEVKSKDGLMSLYGTPGAFGVDMAVVAKPDRRNDVFAWKLTETRDTFGNRIVYDYLRDAGDDAMHQWDQLYLNRIQYADYFEGSTEKFLVSVEFNYTARPDPFSEHRSGFEIRTRWRCSSIEVHVHHGADKVVRRYDLQYVDERTDRPAEQPLNGASLLHSVKVTGFADDGTPESLPPLEFGYSVFDPAHPDRRDLRALTGESLPPGHLGRPEFELADVSADGLPDVLQHMGGLRRWKNLGNGRFGEPRSMSRGPSSQLGATDVRLSDVDGDGRVDLNVDTGGLVGYFSFDPSREFADEAFQRMENGPSFPLDDPELRLMDVDGNGITDAVRTGTRLEHYIMDRRSGWDPQATIMVEYKDRSLFPNVRFSDPRVKVADMTGDGMQDIVQIANGRVEYWSNQGHGNWGRMVAMRNAPRFNDARYPLQFDPARVLIHDVDGDGLADILYVEDGRVRLWINQGGNGWSQEVVVDGTPMVVNMDAVRAVDLLGTGISGILYSNDVESFGLPQHLFLDLTGGTKPYLLESMDNHMGARTEVAYVPSTEFLVADMERPATRWQTTLPFPVQVVHAVAVMDTVSRTRLTTTYTYHHGYWDGDEREFRGFGRVEQRDTEVALVDGVPAEQISPPLLTKSWFHLGAIASNDGDLCDVDLQHEYWTGDQTRFGQHHSISADPIARGMPRQARRDLLRSLRGSVLRTELYAEDGTTLAPLPYTVSESQYAVAEVEAPAVASSTRQRVFYPRLLAQRTTQWERGDDPMTSVSFTDGFDTFGQPTRQTSVALPRRSIKRTSVNGTVMDEVNLLATHARTTYIAPPATGAGTYIADRVAEVQRFEPVAPIPFLESDPNNLQRIISDQVRQAQDFHDLCMADVGLTRTGHTRNFYDGPSFVGLDPGLIGLHGTLTRSETLVFTDRELDRAYDAPSASRRPDYLHGPMSRPAGAPDSSMASLGYRMRVIGGVRHYYTDTLRQQNDLQAGTANPRGLTVAARDVFDNETQLHYDAFSLFPIQTTDPVGLATAVDYDYRVMQPRRVTDPNGNATVMAFTPLGLPERMYLEGATGEGGTFVEPEVRYAYDFVNTPVSVTTIQRVDHVKAGRSDQTIRTVDFSDGFGRQVQSRRQAEEVIFGDPVFGHDVVPRGHGNRTADRRSAVGVRNTSKTNPNVVVSGAQRYDNKSRVIAKHEPYFDRGWSYVPPTVAQTGEAIRMSYDPRGQLLRTLNPDGSEQRVLFGIPRSLNTPGDHAPTPWESYAYDANDLAPLTTDPLNGRVHTANAPASHHFTPASTLMDAMGRALASIQRDGSNASTWIITRSSYDVRGNLLTITDALGRVAFRHAYDLLDRPLLVDSIDAGLRTTVLNALGAPVEYRDDKGTVAVREYQDALNRLTRVWAQDDAASPFALRERLTYGDGGANTQAVALRAAARIMNQLGKLVQHDDEAGRCLYPAYDFKGNGTEKVRLVISDTELANGWTPDWGASNADNALDPTEYRTSTRFDALNRPIDVSYPADVNGHRAMLEPVYNRAGALEQVKLDGALYVERLAYNARGQRTLLSYGNSMLTRYAYDARTFRLARLRTERCALAGTTYTPEANNTHVRQDNTYRYDLGGNILSIEERVKDCGIPGTSEGMDRLLRTFTYDAFNRLTSATGRESDLPPAQLPWQSAGLNNDPTRTRAYLETYTYDQAGNILSMAHSNRATRSYAPEVANNRLDTMTVAGAPAYRYTYDANGNMTSETTSRRFAWDHADRMKGFEEGPAGKAPTVRARYLYGADGMRVKKWVRKSNGAVNDESTTYIDGLFEHHRWQDGRTKQNNHLHLMDGQNRIAIVRVGAKHKVDGGELVQYHLGDHLGGSAVVLGGADATANTFMNREEYTPYGETSFGSFGRKRYRYSGKERDDESGLSYFGMRYYAAALLAWIQIDPAGPCDSINLFKYVDNNPVNLRDELGFEGEPTSSGTQSIVFDEVNVTGTPMNIGSALKASREARNMGWTEEAEMYDQVFQDLWQEQKRKCEIESFKVLGSLTLIAIAGAVGGQVAGAGALSAASTLKLGGLATGAFVGSSAGAGSVAASDLMEFALGRELSMEDFAIDVAKGALFGGLLGGAVGKISGNKKAPDLSYSEAVPRSFKLPGDRVGSFMRKGNGFEMQIRGPEGLSGFSSSSAHMEGSELVVEHAWLKLGKPGELGPKALMRLQSAIMEELASIYGANSVLLTPTARTGSAITRAGGKLRNSSPMRWSRETGRIKAVE
jgi:RHS repeat-associated protein